MRCSGLAEDEHGFIRSERDRYLVGDAVLAEGFAGSIAANVRGMEGIRNVDGVGSHRFDLPAKLVAREPPIAEPFLINLWRASPTTVAISDSVDVNRHGPSVYQQG
jgi:hypothetical protein